MNCQQARRGSGRPAGCWRLHSRRAVLAARRHRGQAGSPKKLENGCRMICAGCASFFGLGLEDAHCPTSWLLPKGFQSAGSRPFPQSPVTSLVQPAPCWVLLIPRAVAGALSYGFNKFYEFLLGLRSLKGLFFVLGQEMR